MLMKRREGGRQQQKSANVLASWAVSPAYRKHFRGHLVPSEALVEFYRQSSEQLCDLESFKCSKLLVLGSIFSEKCRIFHSDE